MAIYHLTVKTGSRSGGQSAAAKSQYISRTGAYERGPGGLDRDLVLAMASGHMPSWARDAEGLDAERRSAACVRYWSAADLHERKNGRLYTDVEFALPVELTHEQRVFLVTTFAADRCTLPDGSKLPYTWAMHAGGGTNPHVHLMISERINDGLERGSERWFKRAATKDRLPETGGARKTDVLSHPDWLRETRDLWANAANLALESAGQTARIDHRSHAARGITDLPGQHVGYGKGAARRQASDRNRRHVNDSIRAVLAERARVEAAPDTDTDTDQAAGLAQQLLELTHDDRRPARFPQRERLGLFAAADAVRLDQQPIVAAGSGANTTDAGTDAPEPDVGAAAGASTAASTSGLRDLPSRGVDVRRARPAGVLHGYARDGLDAGRADGHNGMRWAGASDLSDASAVRANRDRVGPAQQPQQATKASGGGVPHSRNELLNAQRAWAAWGEEAADKFARIAARIAEAEAARNAGAPGAAASLGKTATLVKTPTLAGMTATSLRSLDKLTDRDLREQLHIAEKGVGAAQQAWLTALESGDSVSISAARAQSAARRARVAALRAEITARAEAAQAVSERAGVAVDAKVPAEVVASVPASAPQPDVPPPKTTIADISDAELATRLQRAEAAAAAVGQEVELRGAISRALAKRDQARAALDVAGWWSRRAAQTAHDQSAAAVTEAIGAAKRAGLRFGTRADNVAKITAASELHARQKARVRWGASEQRRRAAAAIKQAPTPMPMPVVPGPEAGAQIMQVDARTELEQLPLEQLHERLKKQLQAVQAAASTSILAAMGHGDRRLTAEAERAAKAELERLQHELQARERAEAQRRQAERIQALRDAEPGEGDASDYTWVETPR